MSGLQSYFSDSEFFLKYENQLRYSPTSINHCLVHRGPNFTFIHGFKENVERRILNLKSPPMALQKKVSAVPCEFYKFGREDECEGYENMKMDFLQLSTYILT